MHIQASIYGGRAGDIYGDPIPVPSIYGHIVFVPAIFLGPVAAWRDMVRHGSRRPSVVPSQIWPEAVRTAVIDALAEALVRDMRTPIGEPGPEDIST
jgi:hypothetical protein